MGVDFMSENCRAQMDSDGIHMNTLLYWIGFKNIPVYRTAIKPIGCTLAEAANNPNYMAYLNKARKESQNPLHLIYINTSLQVKV